MATYSATIVHNQELEDQIDEVLRCIDRMINAAVSGNGFDYMVSRADLRELLHEALGVTRLVDTTDYKAMLREAALAMPIIPQPGGENDANT